MNKIQCIQRLFAVMILTAVMAFQVKADVKLPAVFGDNMVLQQQSQVAVWGWAKAKTGVKVTGSWNNKSYSATSDSKGYWKVKIQTPAAGLTPYTLTVSDGKAVTLNNVLIGEVWVCSGQSNMAWLMNQVDNRVDDIRYSGNAGIRCFAVGHKSTAQAQDDCTGRWEVASPQTVPNFTAAGYYFARLINSSLNIPVGLLHTSWGGSPIEAWMTSASLKDIPEKPVPATDADIKAHGGSPTVLYNGMIHPLVGYGIRGAIWYQGEANIDEPALYVKMFDRMVREWRNVWGVGEFPFYYCQIAPFNYGGRHSNSAYIREAQSKGLQTPNTGMAVLMDANSPHDIHPTNKKDAGERMALWALAKTYGWEKMHYRSPEYKSLTIDGRVAIVTLDAFGAPSGLTTYDKDIRNFAIAGNDKRFHRATAVLAGDKVYLFSPNVQEPVAVRYCWDNTSPSEIFSRDGNLPISSFRTDEW
ncbi:sialic acid-specific 9-O-acetylesterase [Candidatus Symbiothrix dinenymphae]|nr:sialic acid-specific 9-O-acetylesterase [Candidatus Symbiothrix dinenymphae]